MHRASTSKLKALLQYQRSIQSGSSFIPSQFADLGFQENVACESLGLVVGKWFSTLQWDTNQPFKRQQDPKLPPNPSMPADRRERARLQHSRADDASWLGDEKAQRSLEAEQAVTRNTEAEEPVKAKLKLTADGRLPAPQPVRFVSEDGDHRITTYGEAAKHALKAKTRLWVVSLDADPPVVKYEAVAKAPAKPKTMKQQKAAIKEQRKKDLEQRRANTFKEVRVGFKNADNDLIRQLKGAEDLLTHGYRVKIIYTFQLKDMAAAKEKFLNLKQDVDAWGYFEQTEGEGIRQRKMGGGQAAFLVLLLPKRVKT